MTVDVVLFDVFGTLVDYQPDVARLPYPVTHARLHDLGWTGTHDEFVAAWSLVSAELEATAMADHREYGMLDVAAAFGDTAAPFLTIEHHAVIVESFVAEWQLGVRPIDGVADMLHRLAARFRLGVVSNTHDPDLVPALLERLGVLEVFDVVLLSVHHGQRKPHPSIYAAALAAFDCAPARAAFVGDTFAADYEGPRAAGMAAFLVDPSAVAVIPPQHRLTRVTELETALDGLTTGRTGSG